MGHSAASLAGACSAWCRVTAILRAGYAFHTSAACLTKGFFVLTDSHLNSHNAMCLPPTHPYPTMSSIVFVISYNLVRVEAIAFSK
jgi:hypothetical protein